MNKAKKVQIFRNIRPDFGTNILKEADPGTFAFWENSIFAKQQVLFDIRELTQSQ